LALTDNEVKEVIVKQAAAAVTTAAL